MPRCNKCEDGFVEYEEDGRLVRDACYHCSNTGFISEETEFLDLLELAAAVIAEDEVRDWRDAQNADPENEGWDFCAAENGMSGWDYFKVHVWERTTQVMNRLMTMPRAEQNFYAAIAASMRGQDFCVPGAGE